MGGKLLRQGADRAEFEVEPEHGADGLGLLGHDPKLLVLGGIAEGDRSAHPKPLALGGRDLVADALADDLPLELGKRQQHVEGEPAHAGGGIEGLGDRDEREPMLVEQLHQLGKIRRRAGKAIDLVDHDDVDFAAPDIVDEHVRGCGLLLQRLGEVAGARLHLVEQPHVLDRDHGLIGKRLQELFLNLRDRSGLAPGNDDDAERFAIAQHRHTQHAPPSQRHRKLLIVIGIGEYILEPDYRFAEHDPAGRAGERKKPRLSGAVGGVTMQSLRRALHFVLVVRLPPGTAELVVTTIDVFVLIITAGGGDGRRGSRGSHGRESDGDGKKRFHEVLPSTRGKRGLLLLI
jgi:hypothetical protein